MIKERHDTDEILADNLFDAFIGRDSVIEAGDYFVGSVLTQHDDYSYAVMPGDKEAIVISNKFPVCFNPVDDGCSTLFFYTNEFHDGDVFYGERLDIEVYDALMKFDEIASKRQALPIEDIVVALSECTRDYLQSRICANSNCNLSGDSRYSDICEKSHLYHSGFAKSIIQTSCYKVK